jgi:fermentation-respiration switch protein FrsA (DUF1100 family)
VKRLLCFLLLIWGPLSACNHLFFQPDHHVYAKPEHFKYPVQTLNLKTSDGETISAWVMNDVPASKGIVIHFHGNAQNMTAHLGFTSWLLDEGYTLIIFDYRGYGMSTGKPSQKGAVLDGTALIQWIETRMKTEWKGKPMIVIGQSLGGAISSTVLAANPNFARELSLYVIDSSFSSYRLTAREKLGQIWLTWPFQYPLSFLISDDESPAEAIKKLGMPKIFIHGDRDEVVPYRMGQLYFEAAAEPKEFWTIPYGNHTQAFYPGSPYREKLLQCFRFDVSKSWH